MRYHLNRSRFAASLFVCVSLLSAASARADEAFIPFLNGLYDRGYGQLAVDYLKELSARKDLPPEMQAVMDLEMATALRVAAAETLNADESAQWLGAAKEHLEKFLKEHPDNPRAAAAFVAFGDLASERGDKVLARALRDKGKEASPLFLDARKDFEEARPKYAKAVELYQTQFSAAVEAEKSAAAEATGKPVRRNVRPSRKYVPTMVEIAENQLLAARFKLGGADYKLGRTYIDKKDPKRKAAFLAAIHEFDAIYQYNRQLHVGVYAHLYHGKSADEMGDQQLAMDVYEEVLANAETMKNEAGWENLFAEVERSRLEILLAEAQVLDSKKQQGDADLKRDEVITEAGDWIKDYYKTTPQQRSPAYQNISMLLAETVVAKAEKLSGDERKKLDSFARQLLTKAADIAGPYTQDAILLKRKIGGVETITQPKEAYAVGNDAAGEGRWDDAINAYETGLKLSKASKLAADQKLAPALRMALASAQYQGGKLEDAFATAEALARDPAADPTKAPLAAAMAVDAALSLYLKSTPDGRQAALDRLLAIAQFTIKQWPQLVQADEARLALGKVEFANGRPHEAIAVFEAVNPASDRYPSAMYWAGLTRWMLFVGQRQQRGADPAALTAERQKIVQELSTAIQSSHQKQDAGKPPYKELSETMLLLSEVYLDGGEASLAVPLLDPIIAGMQKDKPKELDKSTLRACTAAVRAYITTNEMTKAEGVAALLMKVGEDAPNVNNVLLKFVSTVKNNWKQANATLIDQKGDAKVMAAAKAAVAANKQLLAKMIEPMAKRKQLGLAGMVLVGDTCAELGLNEKAREEYQLVLDKAQDPDFVGNDPHVPAALTRVRAQLIGLLRTEKKYEEALKQVDKLIEDNPHALEPRMERGRILQGWSEEDPSHFPEAVAQWTQLRSMLKQSRQRGPKPKEYYEVIYNAASCLVEEARQAKGVDIRKLKASQAVALLKSTKTLSPNLSGPDMVAKYEVLLGQAEKM
jgi:tetratricopeptide (TPR) repeat protein